MEPDGERLESWTEKFRDEHSFILHVAFTERGPCTGQRQGKVAEI